MVRFFFVLDFGPRFLVTPKCQRCTVNFQATKIWDLEGDERKGEIEMLLKSDLV